LMARKAWPWGNVDDVGGAHAVSEIFARGA